MPVDIESDDFYISLLSNSSLLFYPDNTHARFRNILPRLCKLNDTWCVGITEVALPVQKVSTKRFPGESIEESGKKRTKRALPEITKADPIALRIVLDFDDFHGSLNWTQKQLKEISNKDGSIDFTALLYSFLTRIDPPDPSNRGVTRVKEKMWKRVEADLIDKVIAEASYEALPTEFTLNIKQSDTAVEKVILKGYTYPSIEHFIDVIIGQIPRKRRMYDSLESIIVLGATLPPPSTESLSKIPTTDSAILLEKVKTMESDIHRIMERLPDEKTASSEKIHEEYTSIMNKISSLNELIGEVSGKLDKKTSDSGRGFSKELSMILDEIRYLDKKVGGISKSTSEKSPTVSSKYSNGGMAFISSDIVRPTMVGDRFVRCLRVIPLEECGKLLRFEHIEYHPIEKTFIESISVEVTKQQGELIEFRASEAPSYLMLHFKRR